MLGVEKGALRYCLAALLHHDCTASQAMMTITHRPAGDAVPGGGSGMPPADTAAPPVRRSSPAGPTFTWFRGEVS